jgi:peptidoglycan/xylan/chitin deacetylase (PgdA/CDA1 family)
MRIYWIVLILSVVAVAVPVTTVPWNGYKGAVTFTFDDGCSSQLKNVVPALLQRGIHATFFIPGFSTSSSWIQVARNGNEIANHTLSHSDLRALSSDSVTIQITKQAAALTSLDTSIKALTLAYPGCFTNAAVDSIANKYSLIARSCGGNPELSWNTQPSWMQTPAIMVQDVSTYNTAMTDIADAAKNSKWLITLNHGVGGDWLSVDSSLVNKMFDLAIADSLWIDTYLNVAAYWRASFTMDTVKAISSDSGWTLTWKSPHPKMPASVLLRIKLDASTFGEKFSVFQNGKQISQQDDGSFVIDFMKLQMAVNKGGSGISSSSSSSALAQTAYSAASIPGIIQAENYDVGGEGVAYHDEDTGNSGNVYRSDDVDITGNSADGYKVGYTIAGEWLEYTVNIASAGIYQWEARVSMGGDSAAFHLSLDSMDITDRVSVSGTGTGSWDTYTMVNGITNAALSAGFHVLRITVDRSYGNIDWISFSDVTSLWSHPMNVKSFIPVIYRVYNLQGKELGTVTVNDYESIRSAVRKKMPQSGVYILKKITGNKTSLQLDSDRL